MKKQNRILNIAFTKNKIFLDRDLKDLQEIKYISKSGS